MTDQKIRVLVVDDHPVLRDGVAAILENQVDMEMVGEARNGAEASGRRECPSGHSSKRAPASRASCASSAAALRSIVRVRSQKRSREGVRELASTEAIAAASGWR